MHKPLIGIVAKPIANDYEDWWHFMGIVDDIRLRLIEQGALVAGALPTDRKLDFSMEERFDGPILSEIEKADLTQLIDHFDGIVLEGGLNANPYEREIVKICAERDIPLLGICSGFNNIVAAMGGQIEHHVSKLHQQYKQEIAHPVIIQSNTKLAEILRINPEDDHTIQVNSIHTEITRPEMIQNLTIAAICPTDNTVEAVELQDKKFFLGTKWHPELMPSMNAIFEEFVNACELS